MTTKLTFMRYRILLTKVLGPYKDNIAGTITIVAVMETADAVSIITPIRLNTCTVQNINILQEQTVVADAFNTDTPTLVIDVVTRAFLIKYKFPEWSSSLFS